MPSNYDIIKDAIHGYIKIYDHEKKIIDTPIFQRLRRIKQNTAVHYAYPCATHTRFSHSLGVMHVAGTFTQHLLEQIPNVSLNKKKKYYYLMRLWGLTHDIGHGPFSHTFDDVVLKDKYHTDHEKFGARILRESAQLPQTLTPENGIEISMDEVASLFEVKSIDEWPLRERIGRSDVRGTIFYYICRGAYSADIMDFLLRDSYFTGAGYGNIDWKRLILLSKPLNDKIVLDPRAEEAFDSLLLARVFMFSAVYYHRTTRAAVKLITDFLKKAASKLHDFSEFIDDVDNFTKLDEDFLLFHPDLKDSTYRIRLVERKIPYTRYVEQNEEISLNLPGKSLASELTRQTRNNLPENLRDLPEEAFFVDTSIIRLNPYFGQQEEYIFLADSKRPGGFRARRVRETSWGRLQSQVIILRLFIHDDYRKYENEIIQAFRQKPIETHY